jgi:hypothetical protein
VDNQLPVYFLIIKSAGTNAANGAYTTGLMWCPAIGALLTCKYLGRPVASLGWQWGKTRYQVLSYLIPLGYSTITYSIAWLTGIAAINPIQTADAFRGSSVLVHCPDLSVSGSISWWSQPPA